MLYHVTFTSGKNSFYLIYDYGFNNDIDINDGNDNDN